MSRSTAPTPDLTGKIVLVTGANSGIGLETSRQLAAMGATVVMTARSETKGDAAVAEVKAATNGDARLELLDLSSFASIREFAARFLERYDRLDVLLLNAGGIVDRRVETQEGFEQMFGVNHLGHFLLTDLLRDRLVESAPARVVVVASLAHRWAIRGLDFEDLQSEKRFSSFGVYGRSKLANVLFARELADRIGNQGVRVNAVHPGSINSGFGRDGDSRLLDPLLGMFGKYVMQTVEQGARGPVALASSTDPRYANANGDYFSKTRRRTPSKAARNKAAATRLWSVSEQLVAQHPESPADPAEPEQADATGER